MPIYKYPKIRRHISTIPFKKSQKRYVHISYISNYLYVSNALQTFNSEFRYQIVLKASTWKGAIKSGKISIDTSNIQWPIKVYPSNKFIKDNELYIWSFKDLNPQFNENLMITNFDGVTYSSFSISGDGYTIHRTYDIVASSSLKGYSEKN